MSRQTALLITFLALITGILVFLAVKSDSPYLSKKDTHEITPRIQKSVVKSAVLSFLPAQIQATSNILTDYTTAIRIDTKDTFISGAQVELSYDPAIIKQMTITPSSENSFFGNDSIVLFNQVNQSAGKITYAVATTASGQARKGAGIITTLHFRINPTALKEASAISLLNTSKVTVLGSNDSTLGKVISLEIIAASPSAQ